MILKKYSSIMEKPESHRNKWALGLTVSLTIIIFLSFAFYRGFISFGNDESQSSSQLANVVSAESAPSPLQNSKETFGAAFGEIGEQFQEFKNAMANVLVPFVSSIEVYERDQKSE